MHAPSIQRLITELSKLPGIGGRTAQRLAFHILRTEPDEALALASAIQEVKRTIGVCEQCFNLSEQELCRICQDARRDRSALCVVEESGDIISLERTHEYRGLYHVLGGALSPLDGIEIEDLRIRELYLRLEQGSFEELVLATNPTTVGETTALHIAQELSERMPTLKVTRLASGLPVGADLEYMDEVTLGKALLGRQVV